MPEARRASDIDTPAPIEAVFFYHVPKTAGSTILKYLGDRFPGRVFHPQKEKGALVNLLRRRKVRLHDEDTAQWRKAQAIAGHWASMSLIEGSDKRFYKVCFWRPPADFVISFYNWYTNRRLEKLRRPIDFQLFTRYATRNLMARHFLLYCCDKRGIDLLVMSDWRKFQIIAEAAAGFDRFQDIAAVDDFIAELGITKTTDANVVPKSRRQKLSLSAAEIEALTRRNAVDHYVSRIARGEDRAAVTAEAKANLSHAISLTDLWEALAAPYYRLRVIVLPYLPGWPV